MPGALQREAGAAGWALNEVFWELFPVRRVQTPPDGAAFTGWIDAPLVVHRQIRHLPKSSLSLRSCGSEADLVAV